MTQPGWILLGFTPTSDAGWTTLYTFVFVTITFMVYLYIGWRSRVRETEGFYVAGRGVPAIANGAATAADWMSAASFIGMAGMISFLGFDGSIYLMGWTGGYVLLALLLAPYLRKFGKYTVPDFVGERYYSETARIVAAICAVFVSLTYVAGQMRGVGIVFSRFLEVDIWQGVVVGMVIVAFFAVLGGMKGITWTQVVQFFVLIFAFLIPAVALSFILTGKAIPQVGFTFTDIADKLNALQTDLGFREYTEPFTEKKKLDVFCITFALMVGTAGLPHVIVRFYTVPDVRSARFSAGWALLFIALLYTTAPALALFARYNLLNTLHGAQITGSEIQEINGSERTIYELERTGEDGNPQPISWAISWQRTGLIEFNDRNGDQVIQLDKNEKGRFSEAMIDNDIIVLSTPEVAKLAPWVIALVATGGLAAALSTAAGLLLVISSSIAHDLYIHFIDPHAPEARRVTVGRIMIVVAIVVAGYFGINPPGFVAQVVAFAFGLAAASFFPVILLGIFDKRTNREGAICGMTVGLLFTAVYILGCRTDRIFPFVDQPLFEPWFFGISPEGIGAVGCLLNFVVTLTVSHLTPPPPERVQRFVEEVRVPRGSHEPEAHFDESDTTADNP
ncbi:MAG: cation acetate symporter [Planctomycetales bacterium]|nr:cation acetate symporter [Planctomycetales bacterium]